MNGSLLTAGMGAGRGRSETALHPGSRHSNVPISDIFKGPNYRLKAQALVGL